MEKRDFFLILSIFLLITCGSKKKDEFDFWIPEQSHVFRYGEISKDPVQIEEVKNFEPRITESETEFCIHSHPLQLEKIEWGPVSSFCFLQDNSSLYNVKNALIDLKHQDNSKSFIEFTLKTKEDEAKIQFLTTNEIIDYAISKKLIKLVLGDKRIFEEFSKEKSIEPEKIFSQYAEKENSIETSLSAKYPSYLETDDGLLVLFPPNNMDISISSERYLSIFFQSQNTSILNEFQKFIETISQKNDFFRKNCTQVPPEFTELAISSEFPFRRFLEFKNNSEAPICLENFSIKTSQIKSDFKHKSGFMFPNSVKLIAEKDSRLEGLQTDTAFWKGFKKNETIRFISASLESKWILPEDIETKFETDFYSIKKEDGQKCGQSPILYQKNSQVCADPGSDIYFTKDRENPFCDPRQFRLTEANFEGFQVDGKIETDGKFLELMFQGEGACDLSQYFLRIGLRRTPFSTQKKYINKNEIILVGLPKYFTQNLITSQRDLSFLTPYSNISISNGVSENIVFRALGENESLTNKNASGDIHSITFTENGFLFHDIYSSNLIRPDIALMHQMSPGKFTTNEKPSPIAKISEIAQFGSYKNGSSNSGDKFIEVESQGNGTLLLEIQTLTETRKIYFPVTEKKKFTYLIKSRTECFTENNKIENSLFKLNTDYSKIILKNGTTRLDELTIIENKEMGISQVSPKLRRSYARTGYLDFFKNSTKNLNSGIFPDCYSETEMSPGKENFFHPFLISELSPDHFTYVRPTSDKNPSIQITQYITEPFSESVFDIPVLFSENFGIVNIPLSNTLGERGLIYQSIGNSEELKIFNRENIIIRAVSPDPANPQNEWILICNQSTIQKDLTNFEIEDSAAKDKLTSYFSRKGVLFPVGLDEMYFTGNSNLILPGQCGYVIDPDASGISLQPIGISPTKIFTVESSSTIGNGLSVGEGIDLYELDNVTRIHIHSFGNSKSHSPFKIISNTGEAIILRENKKGENREDYEVANW